MLAQVPDLNDFVAGMKIVLAPTGVLTMEFPHVMRLIEENQFDTIYHEHFGYFSLHTTQAIFRHHGLELFDVEEIPTHGGSLRVYARHVDDDTKPVLPAVGELLGPRGGVRPHRHRALPRASPRRSRRPSEASSSC